MTIRNSRYWQAYSALLFMVMTPTLQAAPEPARPEREAPNWLEHLAKDFAAPVLTPGRKYLLIGSGLTLATLPLKNTRFQASIAYHKPLGSTSKTAFQLGLWKINAAYVAAVLGYGLIASDDIAIQNTLLMVRATAYTAIVTSALKEIKVQERPRGGGDMASFPSGHASNIFTFAGVVQRNHGWYVGVPAFALAGLVSFSRMNDNAHYLHDLVAGATIGLSYAYGLDTTWESDDKATIITAVPIAQSGALGLAGILQF